MMSGLVVYRCPIPKIEAKPTSSGIDLKNWLRMTKHKLMGLERF